MADSATVLIYFADKPPMIDLFGTPQPLNKDEFERLSNLISDYLGPRNLLFSVFVEPELNGKITIDSIMSDLRATGWTPSIPITNLVLAPHGDTERLLNETILDGIGGFSEKGPSGLFKEILSSLKPHFSERFHLQLRACSTVCGKREKLAARVEALFKFIQEGSSVKDVSLWGAEDKLPSLREDGVLHTEKDSIEFNREVTKAQIKVLVITPLLTSFAQFAFSGFEPASLGSFDQLFAGGFGLASSGIFAVFIQFMKEKLGSKYRGLFVRFKNGRILIKNADFFDRVAQTGEEMQIQCTKFLAF